MVIGRALGHPGIRAALLDAAAALAKRCEDSLGSRTALTGHAARLLSPARGTATA
jgi:hypothetical protein